MPALPRWPYPRLCAHRGAGKVAPENTLAALRCGHALGYRMAEFDVKLAADGVPFLLHDDTLDRTTDGRGLAGALRWAELARLDAGRWHSAAYAGEPIPALEEVARLCRAEGIAVNVEIKPSPGADRETGAAVARACADLWAGVGVAPLLSSFSPEALAAARDAVPQLPRAFLDEDPALDWRAHCERLGCVAVDLKQALVTRQVVAAAHASRLRVMAWTVNDPARAAELAGWGVDTLITDAVDAIPPDAFPPAG